MELLRRLEDRARERVGEAIYDYYAGGAGAEQTVAENAAAWRRVWLRPRVMVDVEHVDCSVTLLGDELSLPVVLAPIAAQRMLHPDGELATARAARGAVFCLSTRATTDLADVAAVATGPLWFQLYVQRDRGVSEAVLARAAEHGYRAIVLTVDLPVAGRRERERRHPELELPAGVALASHLAADLPGSGKPLGGWNAGLTWADVAWAREASGLPVLVKGVLTAEDARASLEAGAAGVIVSNHGGRQLDGCVPTAVALVEVVAALAGELPVLVDGAVRDGGDVVRALALGASAVLVGRPFAWGLAAYGEAGVTAVLDALAEDVRTALALAGCASPAEVTREHVRLAGW